MRILSPDFSHVTVLASVLFSVMVPHDSSICSHMNAFTVTALVGLIITKQWSETTACP